MQKLKQLVKGIVFRPSGLRIGARSHVGLPRWLINRDHIMIGDDCFVGRYVTLHAIQRKEGATAFGTIAIHNDVYIGHYSQIHSMGKVTIGDGSVISEHVYVSDASHGFDPHAGRIMSQPLESHGPVVLGKCVFLGYGATVLPGVTLGDNCVVAARAVVTRSFPSGSMLAGVPARLIKTYNNKSRLWEAV